MMGLFSKLKFGKKDDLGLPKDSLGDFGSGSLGLPNDGMQQDSPYNDSMPSSLSIGEGTRPASMSSLSMQQPHSFEGDRMAVISKDIEVISSKIDVLKATLDSVNSRIANLERIAQGEQEKKRTW